MPTPSDMRDFDEVLPSLRAARRAGKLVPFLGAGISRPECRGWPDFIQALYREFDESPGTAVRGDDPEGLYRAADRVAAWLRLRSSKDRQDILQQALHARTPPEPPDQAKALAEFVWPLILTTNYDEVVPRAYSQNPAKEKNLSPLLLGRSPEDCAQVVRSLDTLAAPIVWYLQGYVGDSSPSRSLLDEVVIGHQQYQEAINAGTTFRRAFSEIYRRRSLLFIGSGLAESYFVNLISETMFSLGPSTQPHYALFCDADNNGRLDPEFIAVRLGITPVRYGKAHGELPEALRQIASDASTTLHGTRVPGLTSVSYAIPRASMTEISTPTELSTLDVEIRNSRLPTPAERTCVILSVGRDPEGGIFVPACGQQATSFLEAYLGSNNWSTAELVDNPGLPQGRMWRVVSDGKRRSAFLLAGRDVNEKLDRQARSLAAITEATHQALKKVEALGFTKALMGLLAAGPSRTDEPPYCLVAQLSGIRAFAAESRKRGAGLRSVAIHIIDDHAWSALMQGRIPVLDLLTSELARVLVRVRAPGGSVEEFAVSVPHDHTIDDVLRMYRISGKNIEIEARPSPRRGRAEMGSVRVFPGMIIDVFPSPSEGSGNF
ncbi:SIR2 family NAD-dependent protein deacylase [Roseomonas rosulenta]|uniref:SIR2 family NAD-dependent protein deacylase n=1 Tax=Roseomonas rosulenta TaxID=2748667 RepID=UPI0018DF6431|nr:SIR2 family protein [Roseomonas rosulenta]